MSEKHCWDDLLTDIDRIVIEKGGYGQSRGFGKKPLLLIIDCQPNYVGADKPIEEQLDEWPSGGGATAWASVRRIIALRDVARECGIPIMYTKNVQRQTLAFDGFSSKTKRDQTKYLDGNPASDLLPELAPLPNELVIPKAYASVFNRSGKKPNTGGRAASVTCPRCGSQVSSSNGKCPVCGANL